MLNFSGIDNRRLKAGWVSSAEAPELVHEFNSFLDQLREIGPSPLKKDYRSDVAEIMEAGLTL